MFDYPYTLQLILTKFGICFLYYKKENKLKKVNKK